MYSLFDRYDEIMPRARKRDPETSAEAADSVLRLNDKRKAVLSVIRRHGPVSDEDIATLYPDHAPEQSPSGLRTRRSELVKMGLVRWSGAHTTMDTGRRARLWEAA